MGDRFSRQTYKLDHPSIKKQNGDSKEEREKTSSGSSWKDLLSKFAEDTTLHGLKYLPEPNYLPEPKYVPDPSKNRSNFRRFIWIALILAALAVFIYMSVEKAKLVNSYEKKLDLDITYERSIRFPTVTICNQSPLRLTALHEKGLLELMMSHYASKSAQTNDTTNCDEYLLYSGICVIPKSFADSNILVGEATRSVCRSLCSNIYDTECSSFLFNRTSRTCILSAYTGEWLLRFNASDPVANATYNCSADANRVEFYRRKRCLKSPEFFCNFEDGLCPLTNDTTANETWTLTQAQSLSTINVDNTLNLKSGHFQLMSTSDDRLGYFARLQSPYINTTGQCVELFYWPDATIDEPILSIIVISEEKSEVTVNRSIGESMAGWNRLFARLPIGVHRVVIEGRRRGFSHTGMAVDDIVVQLCEKFDNERECRVNPMGTGYFGTMNRSGSGESCLTWSEEDSDYGQQLPDVYSKNSRNYCRNILGNSAWTQPSCLVATAVASNTKDIRLAPCDIKYCECRNKSHFKCGDGKCIPQELKCNRISECNDGSDEDLHLCANKRDVNCDFDDPYLCGYETPSLGILSWTRRTAIDTDDSSFQGPKADGYGSLSGNYMIFNSRLGQVGDRMQLISPLINISQSAQLQFSYYMSQNQSSGESQLELFQLSKLRTPFQLKFDKSRIVYNYWQGASVCLPNGSYYLLFQGTMGNPLVSDIAIDSIRLLTNNQCQVDSKAKTNRETACSGSTSVNCTFMGSKSCGYTLASTSSNLEQTYKFKGRTSKLDSDKCDKVYQDTMGFIFLTNWLTSCSSFIREIQALNGSVITIAFSYLNLSDENIEVKSLNEKNGNWTSRKNITGSNRPQQFSIKAIALRLIYNTNHHVDHETYDENYEANYEDDEAYDEYYDENDEDNDEDDEANDEDDEDNDEDDEDNDEDDVAYYEDDEAYDENYELYDENNEANDEDDVAYNKDAMDYAEDDVTYDENDEDNDKNDEEERVKFNVTYKVSTPKNADLQLALRMRSQSGGEMGLGEHTARLMSPPFQLSNDETFCLVLRFKALDWLRIMLRYMNSSDRYEEKLLHRNLEPMSSVRFFTLRRDVGGFTVEGQQFVLVFESKSQQVNKDFVIIRDIKLQENQCNYTAAWDGFCDFNSTNGSCPIADQSELGYSWSPALLNSSNNDSTTGLRSEFDGSSKGEESRLLTPSYTSTEEAPCLLLSTTFNSTNIRLNFSLVHADNTSLLPTPMIDQTTSPDDSEIQLYYIHLPVGVPVMLEIKASQFYSGSKKYSAVFLRRIESNSCNVTQPEMISAESINCRPTQKLSSCGYRYGADWSDSSSSSDNQHSLLWGNSKGNSPETYKYNLMQNVALTSYINISRSALLTFRLDFTEASDNRSLTSLRLEIYRTSSPGLLTSKLASYPGDQNTTVEICLPSGRFQLAFLAYTNAYSVSSNIELFAFQLTEIDCTPTTQISYPCADKNVCLSRVVSPSPQFVWKYTKGQIIRIEGDDVLIVVYDLYGTLNIAKVENATTIIYLNAAGGFVASLNMSIATDKSRCQDDAKLYAKITFKENELFNVTRTNLSTASEWSSTDVLKIFLTADVARCVKLIMYSIRRDDTAHGYSLQLVRNSESDLTESDNLTAQWTSDVIRVGLADGPTIVCLAVDLVLPSSVQAKLFQELQNGTFLNRSVFTIGNVTNDQIRGEFKLPLDRNASRIQVAVFFNENATINNISLELGPCHQNAAAPNTNLSCDFKNFDTCGYHDASEKESRWVATASQTKPTGVVGRRECVSDVDGISYVGRQNVTYSGRSCLPWYSPSNVEYPFDDVCYFADSFADSDQTITAVQVDVVSNYCRNPSFDGFYEIWPWCYVKGFTKEYCPIPFCQEYFMRVVFGKRLDSAELQAPLTQFKGAGCLQFQYRLSHPKIILTLQCNASSTQILMELNYTAQVNASNWSTAKVTLNSPDDQIHHVVFVAEKIGFTVDFEYAAIRDIVMTNSPCPQPGENKPQEELTEQYTGNRLPMDKFKELLLNETAQYNAGDLANMTGHLQDSLIYKCEWNGAPCAKTDIRSELTDLGLCYTFNGGESRILSSNNTGANFGLRLVLNVEQYEHVDVYNNTGIKIHLRNYDDIPQVKDSGFAVAPGYEMLAPLDHLTVENLEPPWGNCSNQALEYFNSTERYTTAKCQLECKTKSVIKACGCKNFFMPGPNEICSVDRYLSCAESAKDEGQCSCPVECQIFSYATALSFSQLSGVSFADILRNTDSIRNDYWKSLEIAHRVDDTKMMTTISTLESVTDSYRQLNILIYQNILNPATSLTNLVLKAVGQLIEIVRKDATLSQRFLENFQSCYKRNIDFLVQTISDQLRSASKELGKWQNSANNDSTAGDVAGLLENINTMMQSANESLFNAAQKNNQYCPENFFATVCPSFKRKNLTTDDLMDAQPKIYQVQKCISQYADFLEIFKTFLDTLDGTVPKIDMTVATRTMNTLSTDASWLEHLLDSYRNGSMTTHNLSTEFLRESNNRFMPNLESAFFVAESSVLNKLETSLSATETRTISVYTQLLNYMYKLQTFMPVKETNLNSFARKRLLLWRSPIPTLQDKTIFRFKLTPDQLEQTLGVELTLAGLVNRFETLTSLFVFAYDTSLRQTVSTLQSELHSAQQKVINSIKTFSQQLNNFNDSTMIGDSFVRNNFLKVNIFYGELKNQTIRQTKGYDIFQFLGDFGGWFGLYLGGSFLSIFELLDFLIYNFIHKKSTKKQNKLPSMSNVRPTPEFHEFEVHSI